MRAAGELFEHVAGVVAGAGLPEDVAFESHDRVRRQNDSGTGGAGGDEFGFGVRETLDVVAGRFAGEGRFVDGGGNDAEGEAGVVENFSAAPGCGGEDEFHEKGRAFDA